VAAVFLEPVIAAIKLGGNGSQALWFTEMTAVEVLGSVDELAAGTGGSIDAVTGGGQSVHIGNPGLGRFK